MLELMETTKSTKKYLRDDIIITTPKKLKEEYVNDITEKIISRLFNRLFSYKGSLNIEIKEIFIFNSGNIAVKFNYFYDNIYGIETVHKEIYLYNIGLGE